MDRYELESTRAARFWEIELKGTTFTTRYGIIGKKGQSTKKTFASQNDAKKAYEKLIAEKLANGYVKVKTASKVKKASAKARGKLGAEEKMLQYAAKQAKKTVSADSTSTFGLKSDELKWYLENQRSGETTFCKIEVLDNSLHFTWGAKETSGQTIVEEFASSAQAETAGLLLSGGLLQTNYKQVKPKSREKSEAEIVCDAIIRDVGKGKLEKIGSLVEQVTSDDSGQAANEILKFHKSKKLTEKEFCELIAVASGAELADMGERGGFIMNVVTSVSPNKDDLDSLTMEAVSYVDIYSFWPEMFRKVTDLLVRNNRVEISYSNIDESDKDHYFKTMEASFLYFVKPRLKKAIKRYRS